ncbi:hypothetical protein Megvenef_00333 [Candidatus Megaera venefica]|uniref:Uncharacterized protein n=1 Tax=Candidatus Megaera venefica TaxID=2055910 RepID=A0ABU5NB22_9RICK|nr:hypothetical protein [Candidatus Megaera venefica]MEA0970374.1 hypothetical protein [Candidatus Megaera venefica]
MTMELNIGQQKILQDLNDYWDYTRNSNLRKKWLDQYLNNLKYYCGDQWSQEVLQKLETIQATPYTINRIEPLINAYSSLQIQSNKRIGFKSTTDLPLNERLAEYLSYMAHVIQTQGDFSFYSSLKYTSALIGGVGWSHFGYEEGKFFYDYVDPREVYWDPDDSSPRLEQSNFVCHSYFVAVPVLKRRYPKYAEFLEQLVDKVNINSSSNTDEYNWDTDNSLWTKGRTIRIVEVYYKAEADYYEATTIIPGEDQIPLEQIFCTFSKEMALNKSEAKETILERKGTQIFKGVFCDSMLLEHGAIAEQVPNQKHFPLLPLCLRRDYTGMPYGVVNNLIPLSQALNYIWTKTIHGIDQKILISSNITADEQGTEAKWIEKLQQKIAVIISANPQDAKLYTPEQTLPHFFNLLQRIDVEFEQSTYLFDELKGNQTNAVSGVAIQQRAANSARVQNPLNMAYDHLLLSEGQLLLDTIKGIKDFKYTFNYYKDGHSDLTTLDDIISVINFEVYTDVVPNFNSSIEEERGKFAELLNSNNPGFAMSSPLFLKELGLRKYNELSEEYLRILSGQMESQENVNEE